MYSGDDGMSPKTGGQKVMEPKGNFRITSYMAIGNFPGVGGVELVQEVEAGGRVQTPGGAPGQGQTC